MKKLSLLIVSVFFLSACATGGYSWKRASAGDETILNRESHSCALMARQEMIGDEFTKPDESGFQTRQERSEKVAALFEGCMLHKGWEKDGAKLNVNSFL